MMPFTNHKDREGVVSELHLRRMPALAAPLRMIQILRVVASDDRAVEALHVAAMPIAQTHIRQSDRHVDGCSNEGIEFLWEQQSEASTATIILPGAGIHPFVVAEHENAAMNWLYEAPGEVLRAIRIEIVEDDLIADAIINEDIFERDNLVSCRVPGGARFWSDFKLGQDGFGRLLVAANGMSAFDLGRAVQRFQELGNYRNLALLGLKVTQTNSPELAVREAKLLEISEKIVVADHDDLLLDALIDLAARTTALNAQTAYRMSATEAYSEVALHRLHALQAEPIAGYQTLAGFTERRLLPAVKTCRSFGIRLESLAQRIERATAQLRTRIEMRIQNQNSEMLASMNESSARQLKLQHLVEGLSVVGVSYYVVGLIAYMVKAVDPVLVGIDSNHIVAYATPAVIMVAWFYLRRRMNRTR
ncbi:DUF3422 domain-containing protein [Sphingopyxis sp.]|uniref:DUF3422 domain-containing protein n=1 Tax=Sphingopyxis sp. TaxID=1908224 RepID=UPI001D207FEF|nr:DUF3422 domain-containing protein [Sphingopyxis sp.]MBW8294464.1 DUF3422 domain-containing protein [Sphingopyxis sp.]